MSAADSKASLSPILDRLLNGEALAENDAYALMHRFAAGELDPALAGAFLAGLRAKGETADEVRGFARAMRELAVHPEIPGGTPTVDTVGLASPSVVMRNTRFSAARLMIFSVKPFRTVPSDRVT